MSVLPADLFDFEFSVSQELEIRSIFLRVGFSFPQLKYVYIFNCINLSCNYYIIFSNCITLT